MRAGPALSALLLPALLAACSGGAPHLQPAPGAAPAASVAPLEYTGLAWVMVIDLLVWSAVPSLRTLLGAALIIACGLYLIRFEARGTPAGAS